MCRIAFLSVHTSPLALAGTREAGGMNIYERELARELGRRGLRVDIFTRRQDPESLAVIPWDANVRVIPISAGPEAPVPKEDVYRLLPQFLRGMMQFREATGEDYDLMHSHYWLSGWVGQALQSLWRLPHVTMFHSLGEAKNRARVSEHEPSYRIDAERQIAQSADRVICASQDEKEMLIRLYGVPADNIELVPCGVDLEEFRPLDKAEVRRRLGFPEEPIVLFVGRIEPLKGIDILVRAVAQVSEDIRFCLVVVGGDASAEAEKTELRRLARKLGISRRVAFLDAVDHSLLPLYYNAADVCVVPSYYESFGLVALEAMACGTPVVASRVGGLQGTVRDSETGFLVPWRCPEPFAERLELLLENEELRRNLGEGARAAAEDYAWPRIAERVQAVYDRLMAVHHAHACCRGAGDAQGLCRASDSAETPV
jgi:D-inositol-3-phosphate glycosyltransferase